VSLLAKFTVKPLLWSSGMLLLACIGLSLALVVANSKRDTAQAERDTAIAERDTAVTEREAHKQRSGELQLANAAYGDVVKELQAALKEAQGENRRISAEGQRAIAAAQAEAADADRTLKAFTAQFQAESRKPNCARALAALGQACPALEGY
jgi:cell division protein FtsL